MFESVSRLIKNKSVIVTWLVSYISVLLIPIAISGIVYFQTLKIVESGVVENNLTVLSNIQKNIDGLVSNNESISIQLLLNKNVQKIASVDENALDSVLIEMNDFAREISNYKLIVKEANEFFVFFNNNNMIVGPNAVTDNKYYFYSHGLNNYLSDDRWHDELTKYSEGTYIKLTNKSGRNNQIMYRKTLSLDKSQSNKSKATFVAIFNDDIFLNNIKNISYIKNNDSAIVVAGKSGVLISTTDKYNGAVLSKVASMEGEGWNYMETDGKKMVLTYIKSQLVDWRYICIIPEKVFWERMEHIRLILIVGLIISLVAGLFISYYLTKRNYNPLKKVLDLFGKNVKEGGKLENEYNFLEKSLSAVFKEKNSAENMLKNQRNIVRNSFLNKLLKGTYESVAEVEVSLEQLDIKFYSDKFAVLLFSMDEFTKLFEEENDIDNNERYRLSQFILANVFQEMVNENNAGYVFETDNMMACIFNFKESSKGMTEIRKIVRDAGQFIKDNFNIHFSISASSINETLAGIGKAYNEATDTMQYKTVMGIDEFMEYEEIKIESSYAYSYSVEKEQRLINYIKSGDYKHSAEIITDVIDGNINNPNISLAEAKCIMFNLVSTMMKTINEISKGRDNPDIKERVNIERLIKCVNLNEMKKELLLMLKNLCEYISTHYTDSGTIKKIKQYIDNNYTNSDINISTVGDSFGLTGPYISKLFREQEGEGILEYINKLRMEKAKHEILEKDENIEKVAINCGYSNTYTFIRIFKKQFGVTPGKFREQR